MTGTERAAPTSLLIAPPLLQGRKRVPSRSPALVPARCPMGTGPPGGAHGSRCPLLPPRTALPAQALARGAVRTGTALAASPSAASRPTPGAGGLRAHRDGVPLPGAVRGMGSRPSRAAARGSRTLFAINPRLKPLHPSCFELHMLPGETPPWAGVGGRPHAAPPELCLLGCPLAFWPSPLGGMDGTCQVAQRGLGGTVCDGAGLAWSWCGVGMVLAWSWCGVGVGRHGAGTGWHGLGRALGTPSCLSQLCHQTPLPQSCPRARMAPWAPRTASSAFRESGVGAPTHPRGLWGQRPVGRSQDGRGSQVWGPALLRAPSPSGSPLSCLEGGGGRVPRARTPPFQLSPTLHLP